MADLAKYFDGGGCGPLIEVVGDPKNNVVLEIAPMVFSSSLLSSESLGQDGGGRVSSFEVVDSPENNAVLDDDRMLPWVFSSSLLLSESLGKDGFGDAGGVGSPKKSAVLGPMAPMLAFLALDPSVGGVESPKNNAVLGPEPTVFRSASLRHNSLMTFLLQFPRGDVSVDPFVIHALKRISESSLSYDSASTFFTYASRFCLT